MLGHDLDLMTRIAENESTECVDSHGNGRIDFADVVRLFNHM
jgi:hypothetical protein